jgi:chromosome segregation ATPase
MVEDCADAREARDEAIQKCESLELEVEGLEGRLEITEAQRQQETTALVGIIAETIVRSRSALSLLRHSSANESDAATNAHQVTLALAVAQVELKNKSVSLRVADQAKADLQSQVDTLQEQLMGKTAAFYTLEQERDEARKLSATKPEMDKEVITQLRAEHAEQLTDLQKQLDVVSCELQEVQARYTDANVSHQQELDEADRSRKELESHLTAVSERTRVGLAEAHAEELNRLQKRIDTVNEELRNAIRSRNEFETLYQAAATELARNKEDYEARLSKATLQSLDATRQLEDDLANTKFRHAEDVGDLEGQLKRSAEEIGRLQVRLREEVYRYDQDQQAHLSALQAKVEQCQRAETLEAELHQEVAVTRTQLEQMRTALQSLEVEKSTLQIESTNLAAEIQRTISLNRFLENEVKAW